MRSSSFVSLALLGAVTPTRLRAQTPAPVSTTLFRSPPAPLPGRGRLGVVLPAACALRPGGRDYAVGVLSRPGGDAHHRSARHAALVPPHALGHRSVDQGESPGVGRYRGTVSRPVFPRVADP